MPTGTNTVTRTSLVKISGTTDVTPCRINGIAMLTKHHEPCALSRGMHAQPEAGQLSILILDHLVARSAASDIPVQTNVVACLGLIPLLTLSWVPDSGWFAVKICGDR